ncbi:hypothetical protein THC_0753 [Caldimicrobium thiodismutans]|uniref:Uncharacterized protein n=1 Tax=Caldimicrobium thiodismutans TaxID=1653476 RepID=A0A0U5AV67_9BACT|nr:hypothetical protein [Caldimicrobium thiodismutans]BAU23144.1 hypothetical protein THC_0753 [Caldimicrobium thiodismutans]
MIRKRTYILLLLFLISVLVSPCFSQNIGRSCDGSQLKTDSGLVFIPKGQTTVVSVGGVRYRCVGCGRCTPESQQKSSGGYTGSYRSTGDWKTDLMLSLLQSFIQGFMRGLQEGGQRSSGSSVQSSAKVQSNKNTEDIYLKEWQNEIEKQTQEMQKQYALIRENEFKEKKQRLLSKLKGPDSSSENLASLKSLKCSAYWSMEAAKLASSGSEDALKKAKEYTLNSEKAMQGDLSSCPDFQLEVNFSGSSGSTIYEEEFQQEFLKVLTHEINGRLNSLNDFKKKKNEMIQEVAKVEEEIKKIEEIKSSAKSEAEKQQYDELLNEAQKTLAKAKEEEKKVDEEILRLNQEIKAISEIHKTLFTSKKENK